MKMNQKEINNCGKRYFYNSDIAWTVVTSRVVVAM